MSFGSPLDLRAATLSVGTPIDVRTATKAALDAGATHYTDTSGIADLREAVATALARRTGVCVAADGEILITSGVREALFVSLQVLMPRSAEVVLVGPAPRADVELVEALGGLARVAPCDANLQLDADAVTGLVTDQTRVMLIHLPSAVGQMVPVQTLELLAESLARHDVYAIAVETDDGPTAQTAAQASLAATDGMSARTVTIGGFGWAGLSAWQVAYLAAPREMMGSMKRLKEEVSISAPAVSQHAALAACESGTTDVVDQRQQLDQRRTAVAAALKATSLQHLIPDTGPFAFIKAPAGADLQMLLSDTDRAGIRVADGADCGADGWLRMTLDYEPALLVRAVSELAQLVDREPSERR